MNFRFTMKLTEIIRTSTFVIKNLKTLKNLNSESFSELENLEIEISFSLKNPIYGRNLFHLPLGMLKELQAIVDDFK